MPELALRRLALIALVAAAVAIAVGALIPQLAPPEEHHLDKLVHIGAFGLLALLATVSEDRPPRAVTAAVFIVMFGGAIEIAQCFVPGRTGSWSDLLADSIGVAVGCWAGRPLWRILRLRVS